MQAHSADLQNTTLGRLGHLAVPQSATRVLPTRPSLLGGGASLGAGSNRRVVAARGGLGPREWLKIYNSMFNWLKPVGGMDALAMTRDGAVIADVRTKQKYEESTIKGAVSVPLFQTVEGWSLKKLVTASMGLEATVENPDFATMAAEKLPKDKTIILACQRGGILKPGTDMDNLQTYTQSLRAADKLKKAGFDNLVFLEGGIYQWKSDGFPMTSEELPVLQSHGMPIAGLIVLASLAAMLAMFGLKQFCNWPKPTPTLQESLIHV